MLPQPRQTCLLIADISGYTDYLAGVELDHAQDILADLVGAVVTALRPTFRLAKLEGDAAFTYAAAERIDGSVLLDTIERCYFGFRRRRRDVRQATSCDCRACVRIPTLDLKFVVHHGDALLTQMAGRQELMGPDVILVHRLLKNQVAERHALRAYALLTQACVASAGLDPGELGMTAHDEPVDGLGEVAGWVHDLEARWSEEDVRERVHVPADGALLVVSVHAPVPPQVAWQFLTRPGQRMSWQPWVTSVEVKGATGGRRGPGSSNHCMHGKDAVVEQILDWRPYDYVTDRTIVATPAGPLRLLHTIELEPDTDGTTIHMRFAPPERRKDRALAAEVGASYGAALRSSLPALVEQLTAELAAREADPELTPAAVASAP